MYVSVLIVTCLMWQDVHLLFVWFHQQRQPCIPGKVNESSKIVSQKGSLHMLDRVCVLIEQGLCFHLYCG